MHLLIMINVLSFHENLSKCFPRTGMGDAVNLGMRYTKYESVSNANTTMTVRTRRSFMHCVLATSPTNCLKAAFVVWSSDGFGMVAASR